MRSRLRHSLGRLRDSLLYLTAGAWRRALLGLALLALVTALGGFLFVWSGLVSVAASSGHWPATGWLLHFSMRSAVRTQSLGVKAPPLDDPALLLKGAGHFETGCVPCHGAPGQDRSLIARQMTPEPPYLPPRIARWKDRELFWIVKNGIKFTAMPAWPALEREDEVWALVAFLRALPDMSSERYSALANGPVATPGEAGTPDHLRPLGDPLGPVLANCARCHGADGLGRGEGAFPKLAGQREPYLLASLQAYASGQRRSGIMQPIAAGLDEATLRELARHYAALPRTGGPADDPRPASAPGLPPAHTEAALPRRDIPKCRQCHGPTPFARNPLYPQIAGQYADYIALQLELFQAGTRGGTEYAHLMHQAADRLNSEQIRRLAEYYEGLGWDAEHRPPANGTGVP